jgi:hypothetical protein
MSIMDFYIFEIGQAQTNSVHHNSRNIFTVIGHVGVLNLFIL